MCFAASNDSNIHQVAITYNDGQCFGLFINHDVAILEIIVAKSYALVFPLKIHSPMQ
jgi:hypothetical protein